MKLKFLLVLLVSGFNCLSQNKFNTDNYYDYYISYEKFASKKMQGSTITTNWLRSDEIVPIIIEELKNSGYTRTNEYALYKVRDGQHLVLTVYVPVLNFGFLYIHGHDGTPNKKHMLNLTQKQDYGTDFLSYEQTPSGKPNMINIDHLPDSIFVLNENCYWYQYTDNSADNKKLFSKEDAIKILKTDIKAYLLKAPKPNK